VSHRALIINRNAKFRWRGRILTCRGESQRWDFRLSKRRYFGREL
jgi:hypothetical protein